MTDDTQINYNEWDEIGPEPLTQFDELLDLTKWPAGAEDDGRLYRVAWCRNMRAQTTNAQRFSREVEDVLLNADGEIDWIPVDPRFEAPSQTIIDALDGKTGSYIEMSRFANAVNKRQDDNFGKRAFTFFPHPVDLAAAA